MADDLRRRSHDRGADHRAPGRRRRTGASTPSSSTGCSRGACTPAAAYAAYTRFIEPGDLAPASPRSPATVLAGGAGRRAAGRHLRPDARARRWSGCGCCPPRTPGRSAYPGPRCARACSAWRRCRRSGSAPPRSPGPRWSTRAAGAAAGTTCGPARSSSTSGLCRSSTEPEDEAPRQVVNLTAMRLVPASPTPPRRVPSRGQAAAGPPPRPSRSRSPDRRSRRGRGWAGRWWGRRRPTRWSPPSGRAGRACRARRPRAAADRAAAGRDRPTCDRRHPRAPRPLAGHLRHRRAVRGARADPGRPAPEPRPGEPVKRRSRCPPTT